MDEEVGVAADRRREMGVTAQRQTEMPDIVRAIGGLRLTAQNQIVDESGLRGSRRAAQNTVEELGLQNLPLGEREAGNAHVFEKDAQCLDFFWIGRVVN